MKYFPSGIAEGPSFCNRVKERKQLAQYIEHVQPTVIMAARRQGKSSLISQVMKDQHYHYVWVDFLSVTSYKDVEEKIRHATRQLLIQLSPEIKKIQIQAMDKVKALSPEVNLSALGQTLSLSFNEANDTPIDQLLVELDQYAAKKGKQAVLVFDEFQQISEIDHSQTAEALIRHAVERANAITYIFSGSNRHMLQNMFSESNRPLYRLCTLMQIERIDAAAYVKFIQKAAKLRWSTQLDENVIETILLLTERHPFYINALCRELWLEDNPPKTTKKAEAVWRQFVTAHRNLIVAPIISLPLNQKKLIKLLSCEPEAKPYSADFSIKAGLSTASIRRSIEALLLKDIIYHNDGSIYTVLDPAISYYFKYLY
ncbi:MAG: ATP-binding protein [Coxiellaceae bacterium]|nr:ATP-binding protein [Coxiellaceae bacterium]